jgi:hypothetical protein
MAGSRASACDRPAVCLSRFDPRPYRHGNRRHRAGRHPSLQSRRPAWHAPEAISHHARGHETTTVSLSNVLLVKDGEHETVVTRFIRGRDLACRFNKRLAFRFPGIAEIKPFASEPRMTRKRNKFPVLHFALATDKAMRAMDVGNSALNATANTATLESKVNPGNEPNYGLHRSFPRAKSR